MEERKGYKMWRGKYIANTLMRKKKKKQIETIRKRKRSTARRSKHVFYFQGEVIGGGKGGGEVSDKEATRRNTPVVNLPKLASANTLLPARHYSAEN